MYKKVRCTCKVVVLFTKSIVIFDVLVAVASSDRKVQGLYDPTTRTATKTSKKTIGFISKTTTSHVHRTYLYISFPFLHDYDVKMANFAFYGERKQAKTKFDFSF